MDQNKPPRSHRHRQRQQQPRVLCLLPTPLRLRPRSQHMIAYRKERPRELRCSLQHYPSRSYIRIHSSCLPLCSWTRAVQARSACCTRWPARTASQPSSEGVKVSIVYVRILFFSAQLTALCARLVEDALPYGLSLPTIVSALQQVTRMQAEVMLVQIELYLMRSSLEQAEIVSPYRATVKLLIGRHYHVDEYSDLLGPYQPDSAGQGPQPMGRLLRGDSPDPRHDLPCAGRPGQCILALSCRPASLGPQVRNRSGMQSLSALREDRPRLRRHDWHARHKGQEGRGAKYQPDKPGQRHPR